ncbi:MAG: DAK2 domain-containing protein [Spirochaetales bacterium]|nr:DAK2 domain-containing protein [Spirochaetales bacterium]
MALVGSREIREMLAVATGCLEAKASQIDALNVFPIPDGDTGTNMLLTMRSALRAVRAAEDQGFAAAVEAAGRGALLGARGNSGVILSQFLVGMSQELSGGTAIGCAELGRAFRRGSDLAYQAVSEPVEGTMLTVMREASEATRAFEESGQLAICLEAALRAAGEALARTPELLPVLRAAGVVDAGGQGLYTLLEGALLYARGQREAVSEDRLRLVPARIPAGRPGAEAPTEAPAEAAGGGAGAPSFGYCVEFVLDHGNRSTDQVTRLLAAQGSSLVVAGARAAASGAQSGRHSLEADIPVRVHIHCGDPEELIRQARTLGGVEQVQIRDMTRQHAEYQRRRATPGDGSAPQAVAVVPGAGLAKVFLSLGASVVVVSSRSPSAEELLDAVESAPVAEVVLLPNHKNIVPVAEQARKLSSRRVIVVPTVTVPQGVAAMVAFAGESGLELTSRRMLEALAEVYSIEVCRAVRSTRLNGVRVAKNQFTGYLDGELVVARPSAEQAVRASLERLAPADEAIVTLYHGADVPGERARELASVLRRDLPGVSVEVLSGGQALYDYLVGVE